MQKKNLMHRNNSVVIAAGKAAWGVLVVKDRDLTCGDEHIIQCTDNV